MLSADVIRERLAAPFPVNKLGFRPQNVKGNRALALPYIDARDVQDRLDDVVGVNNWQDEYQVLNDGSVVCQLRVRIEGEWVVKTDTGSPSEQPDAGDRLKAAFSDALKRSAVKWGVGRYLYSIDNLWADYDPQSKQIKNPQLPAFAIPKGSAQPSQQQRPAANPAPQQQAQQRPPQQQQPQQVNVAEIESAVKACKTMAEVEALVLATQQNVQQGRIPEDKLGQLQNAVTGKTVALVTSCANADAAKEVSAVFQRNVMRFIGQGKDAVVGAFNTLKSRLDSQQQQQDATDPFNR